MAMIDVSKRTGVELHIMGYNRAVRATEKKVRIYKFSMFVHRQRAKYSSVQTDQGRLIRNGYLDEHVRS